MAGNWVNAAGHGRRSRAPLQPFLDARDRPAPGGPARHAALAHRGACDLRARTGARDDRDGARPGARSRSRASQPRPLGSRRLRPRSRKRAPDDGRRQLLSLTRAGTAAFEELDRRSTDQSSLLLEQLTLDDQSRLLTAMSTIEEVLGPRSHRRGLVLRSPAPGRVRLGRRAPRSAVRARVRLRRELRGPRRADRRRVRPAPRSGSRASLDRRPRRRARRLGLLRRRGRRRREAAPADRRPRRPGPPRRQRSSSTSASASPAPSATAS